MIHLADVLPSMSPMVLAAISAVFVLAGVVKGVVGLGLPTIAMALLAILMTPPEAAALLIVPSLITNLWQAGPLRTLGALLRRLGGMQVGVVAGTLAGVWLFGALAGAGATAALGVALVVYALWGFFGKAPQVSPSTEAWLGPLMGIVTGAITSATGVFAIPAVPYLQMLKLGKDGLIQAMGISFTVSTIALAAGLWIEGRYAIAAAGTSAVMIAPALLGMFLGTLLRKVLTPEVFRTCFLASLLLLGLYQIWKAVQA